MNTNASCSELAGGLPRPRAPQENRADYVFTDRGRASIVAFRKVVAEPMEKFFACPICANTLVPGATLTYPRVAVEKGAGRVWDLSNGAPKLVECTRCQGSGQLLDLRDRADRRNSTDRRSESQKRSAR